MPRGVRVNRVLHLCSVCVVKGAQSENAVFSIARTRCQETQCSLFPIYSRIPKLDVADSLGSAQLRSAGAVPRFLARNPLGPSRRCPLGDEVPGLPETITVDNSPSHQQSGI